MGCGAVALPSVSLRTAWRSFDEVRGPLRERRHAVEFEGRAVWPLAAPLAPIPPPPLAPGEGASFVTSRRCRVAALCERERRRRSEVLRRLGLVEVRR